MEDWVPAIRFPFRRAFSKKCSVCRARCLCAIPLIYGITCFAPTFSNATDYHGRRFPSLATIFGVPAGVSANGLLSPRNTTEEGAFLTTYEKRKPLGGVGGRHRPVQIGDAIVKLRPEK